MPETIFFKKSCPEIQLRVIGKCHYLYEVKLNAMYFKF